MSLFNWNGLLLMAVILIPNILFARLHPEGFANQYHNRALEILEQLGRFGCFGCMIVSIPRLCLGFWFPHALLIYRIVNGALVLAYCLIWYLCWNQNSVFKSLALSILPSAVFLFSGILQWNLPLILFSILFAPCHIAISCQNAVRMN